MHNLLDAIALWLAFGFVPVQEPGKVVLQYRFAPGQVLSYEAKQEMTVESTVSGTTQRSKFLTESARQWKVLDVDGQGNARLALTVQRVQVHATGSDGKQVAFDTDKDGARSPLASLIGKPLVEIRISPSGQITDIRESQTAEAGQFVAHVRTQIYPLPPSAVAPGTGWQREITLPLPPPIGAGEQVRIRQTFRLEKVSDSVATINLQSAPAEEIKDRVTLQRIAQFLPSGRFELDLSRGFMRLQELTLDQKVTEFAGSDSVMHVTGTYREILKEELAGSSPRRR
jgi:hypothetical protein